MQKPINLLTMFIIGCSIPYGSPSCGYGKSGYYDTAYYYGGYGGYDDYGDDDGSSSDGDPLCNNDCEYAYDGDCDDGGAGSDYDYCEYGSDCADCGRRTERGSDDGGSDDGGSDDGGSDDGGSGDGGSSSTPYGCGYSGYFCWSLTGSEFDGQEESTCYELGVNGEESGNPPIEHFPSGCPSGAYGKCQFYSPEYISYYYDGSPGGADHCHSNGGSWTNL
ncbi:MAG: hypothetical protein ACPGTU_03030 [Myxococcota bacterium]